jgi:uncharacterized protein (TIGR03435 family)
VAMPRMISIDLARYECAARLHGVAASMIRSTSCPGLMFLMSSAIFGQSSSTPAFEVATIKLAMPTTGGGRTSSSGNTVVYNNTTLLNALARAFGVTSANQIVGPAWVFENRYDIVAKAPDNTPKEQLPLMLQTLLIDRFKLTLHHETRDLPAYVLVKGNGKLKLVQNQNDRKNSTVMKDGHREMKSMNMAALAQFVTPTLRRPVVDRTGLSGDYDFPFDFTQEETGHDSAPSIFSVVADIGLKLESRRTPFDVIVIDTGNKVPTEN